MTVTSTPRGPLAGVRVVELATIIAGPAAAMMLADWGASVIKIEPLEGDPQRGNVNSTHFELDNRGKRSICIDLKTPEGEAIARRLIEDADVFITNLRTKALARLSLDAAALCASNPRLVYASISGYGDRGAGSDKPTYDAGAYWSRAGVAWTLTPPNDVPPVSRPGLGDHPTGLGLVAGIAAALYERERTGRGQIVSTSLLRAGIYAIGSDVVSELGGFEPPAGMRRARSNPLLGVYRSGDERWFWLLGVQATRHWPGLMRAIARTELSGEERFRTLPELIKNRNEVISVLDAAFAEHPLAYWAERFAEHDVWWDPVQTLPEVVTDPIVNDSGALRDVEDDGARTVATPVDFSRLTLNPAPRAPQAGQHTEEILLELGYDWSAITG